MKFHFISYESVRVRVSRAGESCDNVALSYVTRILRAGTLDCLYAVSGDTYIGNRRNTRLNYLNKIKVYYETKT